MPGNRRVGGGTRKKRMKEYFAEELNFWQTSRKSPDEWIEGAKKQIQALGGKIEVEAFGRDSQGRAAFVIGFSISGDAFKIIWPVVKSKAGNEKAARRQAATSLYHYVKGICLYSVVAGPRPAFFSHLMLPGGKIASEVVSDKITELVHLLPSLKLVEHK